jgi:hypothetical protein
MYSISASSSDNLALFTLGLFPNYDRLQTGSTNSILALTHTSFF